MELSANEKTKEYWFIFQHDRLLFLKDSIATLPTSLALEKIQSFFLRQHAIGQYNGIDCYCAEISEEIMLAENMTTINLRRAYEILGAEWYSAATKAFSVIHWDKTHQFCGRCGHATMHKAGTFERICPDCGLALYPRISPSIIVLIQKGDYILMARSPHFKPGAYGLIAGFVEMGESIEEAIHREVKEEIGIKIKNLHYFGSQSWPFPDSLMIGFIADYATGEIMIDHKEIETAAWYRYDNLPGGPSSSMSIARKLIDYFVAQKTN